MRLSRLTKRVILLFGLALLVLGIWELISQVRPPATVRVLAASRDLPVGAAFNSASTTWLELPVPSSAAYLNQIPKKGSIMLDSVPAGELIPLRSVGLYPFSGRAVLTIKPAILPVRQLRVGDMVDVWVQRASSPTNQVNPALELVATEAEVVAISTEQGAFAASGQRVDLSVSRGQLEGLVGATLTAQAQIELVRAASLLDLEREG